MAESAYVLRQEALLLQNDTRQYLQDNVDAYKNSSKQNTMKLDQFDMQLDSIKDSVLGDLNKQVRHYGGTVYLTLVRVLALWAEFYMVLCSILRL